MSAKSAWSSNLKTISSNLCALGIYHTITKARVYYPIITSLALLLLLRGLFNEQLNNDRCQSLHGVLKTILVVMKHESTLIRVLPLIVIKLGR